MTATKSCQQQYGDNSYGLGTSCYCSAGYEWNIGQTECVAKITNISTIKANAQVASAADSENQDQIDALRQQIKTLLAILAALQAGR